MGDKRIKQFVIVFLLSFVSLGQGQENDEHLYLNPHFNIRPYFGRAIRFNKKDTINVYKIPEEGNEISVSFENYKSHQRTALILTGPNKQGWVLAQFCLPDLSGTFFIRKGNWKYREALVYEVEIGRRTRGVLPYLIVMYRDTPLTPAFRNLELGQKAKVRWWKFACKKTYKYDKDKPIRQRFISQVCLIVSYDGKNWWKYSIVNYVLDKRKIEGKFYIRRRPLLAEGPPKPFDLPEELFVLYEDEFYETIAFAESQGSLLLNKELSKDQKEQNAKWDKILGGKNCYNSPIDAVRRGCKLLVDNGTVISAMPTGQKVNAPYRLGDNIKFYTYLCHFTFETKAGLLRHNVGYIVVKPHGNGWKPYGANIDSVPSNVVEPELDIIFKD